jgi:hypothetical protein
MKNSPVEHVDIRRDGPVTLKCLTIKHPVGSGGIFKRYWQVHIDGTIEHRPEWPTLAEGEHDFNEAVASLHTPS